MIKECHHQGTGMSAGSTAAPVPSAVHLRPLIVVMLVSAVCKRSSHVTSLHQSGPSVRRNTEIGVVCPATGVQKWFSSDISVLKVWISTNGSK